MSARSSSSSAHLGATLRTVLFAPRAGFEAALRTCRRRARIGSARPEGTTPYVLAAIGGAAAAMLWLKVSPLAGLRSDSQLHFRWSYLVAAALLGIAVMLGAQFLWGLVGPRMLRGMGLGGEARELRLVWGAAAFPQVFAVALLVPMDLAIVGPEAFMNVRVEDPLSAGWAALSVALALALGLWSVWLFVRGIQAVAEVPARRALMGAVPALALVGGLLLGLRIAAASLVGVLA